MPLLKVTCVDRLYVVVTTDDISSAYAVVLKTK